MSCLGRHYSLTNQYDYIFGFTAGDGNFGIIPGGTFYPEKDSFDSDNGGFEDFSSYFHNGHGRPSYYFGGNPKPGTPIILLATKQWLI